LWCLFGYWPYKPNWPYSLKCFAFFSEITFDVGGRIHGCAPTLGQLSGTVWDNDSAWFSIDCDAIFGFVPKVFHLFFCLSFRILWCLFGYWPYKPN
jgi:hypothetical protein